MVTIINSDESDDEPEQLQYKVIILGDGAVGKTSLALRFTGDYHTTSYKQTIGVDFFLKQMVLPDDLHVAIQLWDIGGQTIGGKMIGSYIFGAQAVLLVYDITNYQSFANLEDWYSLVQQTFGPNNMPYNRAFLTILGYLIVLAMRYDQVALVANKTDLMHLQAISARQHNQFAGDNDMYSFRLSAKTGAGVQQCFFRVAADLAGILLPKTERQGHGSTNHMPGESSKNPVAELPPMNSVQSGAKGCTKTEGAEEIADALPSERPLAQRGPGRLARNEAKGRLKDGQRCVIM